MGIERGPESRPSAIFSVRLLLIGTVCCAAFFPVYILLHPHFGADMAAVIAIALTWVAFPILLLLIFRSEGRHPLLQICNRLVALLFFVYAGWNVYASFEESSGEWVAMRFFWSVGLLALYFLLVGRVPRDSGE